MRVTAVKLHVAGSDVCRIRAFEWLNYVADTIPGYTEAQRIEDELPPQKKRRIFRKRPPLTSLPEATPTKDELTITPETERWRNDIRELVESADIDISAVSRITNYMFYLLEQVQPTLSYSELKSELERIHATQPDEFIQLLNTAINMYDKAQKYKKITENPYPEGMPTGFNYFDIPVEEYAEEEVVPLADVEISEELEEFLKTPIDEIIPYTGPPIQQRSRRIIAEHLEFIFGDELLELPIVNNDPWSLAQKVGVTILSDKNLLASVVDYDEGRVIAAVFNGYTPDHYSFDTVVDPKYQGRGLGTQLIEIAMDEYQAALEAFPEMKLKLDVINPGIIPFLERTYNLEVKEKDGAHYIMGRLRVEANALKADLEALRLRMAQAAQTVYDEWEQDEEGIDEVYGGGGPCDQISQALADVLVTNLDDVGVTEGGQEGDDHAWVIAYTDMEAYGVDIPPSTYESGGGYRWTKLPDVTFTPEDIYIFPIPREELGELE